jgi:putative ABC transport system substrate-binding protein
LEAAAHALGLSLSFVYVNGRRDFEAALIRAKNEGAAGIIATIDTVTFTHKRALVQRALKHRLPSICWTREYVEEGGLMAYSANNALVEQPTKFELVINLKTAKALSLTIPPSVLARADELIE